MAAECTALDDRIIKLERSHYGCPKEITEVDESMRRARTSVESLGLYSSRWTYVPIHTIETISFIFLCLRYFPLKVIVFFPHQSLLFSEILYCLILI